jgi:hypothetical protein
VAGLLVSRDRDLVPAMFWPLAAYAALTLVSTAFSLDPATSLYSAKQLLLFLVVPVVYRFTRGDRAHLVLSVIITTGALSAVLGVVQYGILGYDNLAHRIQGSLGHWMTYSGLLLLVTVATAARIVFALVRGDAKFTAVCVTGPPLVPQSTVIADSANHGSAVLKISLYSNANDMPDCDNRVSDQQTEQ